MRLRVGDWCVRPRENLSPGQIQKVRSDEALELVGVVDGKDSRSSNPVCG
jgi:hypothetical protein